MATAPGEASLDIDEQIARVSKLVEDVVKAQAETIKSQVKTRKLIAETQYMPRAMAFQAMLATAAFLGAGTAIAKLFFP